MKAWLSGSAAVIFAAVVVACGGSTPNAKTQTVQLAQQETSGRSGTATLTEADGGLTVAISLTGGTDTGSEPAHIHEGTCATPGGVIHALTNVTGGATGTSSTTLAGVTLASVSGKIINVHLSSDTSSYVSCGTIQ